MSIGFIIISLLFLWLALEIVILIIINKKFAFDRYESKKEENAVESEKERMNKESRLYGTRALTLGGLIFAAITFLLAGSKDYEPIKNTLFILVYGLCLCLLSYRIEVLTDKRIYWTLQEKCLNFSYLTLLVALVIYFFEQNMNEFYYLLIIFILVICIIHIKEFYIDGKYYYQKRS